MIQAVSHRDRGVIEKADALIHGLDDLVERYEIVVEETEVPLTVPGIAATP